MERQRRERSSSFGAGCGVDEDTNEPSPPHRQKSPRGKSSGPPPVTPSLSQFPCVGDAHGY